MTTADERNERIGQGEIEIERRDRGGVWGSRCQVVRCLGVRWSGEGKGEGVRG